MSGTQTLIVVLALGGIGLVGIFILLFTALRKQRSGEFEMSFANIFSTKLSLPAGSKDKAVEAVGAAAKFKQQSGEAAAAQMRSQVSALDEVALSRALWVDDKPDNNVYETVALAHLGVFVVSAMSNQAAHRYLSELKFDLVISDLDRGGTSDSGVALLDNLHATRPELPVVFYIGNAERYRAQLLAAGARAVEDQPATLIKAVLAATKPSEIL